MVTVAGIEGRLRGARVWRVVVGKLGKGKVTNPVVLLEGGEAAKVLLEGLIDSFSLAIGLRMEGRGVQGLDVGLGK